MTQKTSDKNPVTELLLCIFLGMFGAHRFYARKYGTAILYLLTAGLFYIGWAVDIVLIIVRLIKSRSTTKAVPSPATASLAANQRADVANVIIQTHCEESTTEHNNTSDKLSETEDKTSYIQVGTTASFTENKYRVAGTTHYLDNIMNLAIENADYDMTKREIIDSCMTDEKIWKYEFYPVKVELVPEPENPNDKNAIKVVVDGEHVGYIKAGSCAHLLKVIRENRIHSIDCDIGGGPYKIVSEEYDYEKDKDVYTLEKDERNYSIILNINEVNSQK